MFGGERERETTNAVISRGSDNLHYPTIRRCGLEPQRFEDHKCLNSVTHKEPTKLIHTNTIPWLMDYKDEASFGVDLDEEGNHQVLTNFLAPSHLEGFQTT